MIIAILLSSDCWPFFCNHNKNKLHGVLINYNNPLKTFFLYNTRLEILVRLTMLLLKLVSRDSLGHVPKNLLSMCLIVHIDFGWVAGKLQKGEYLYVLLSTLYQPVVP